MIEGVMIEPLKIISDERGKVMRMLRCDDPYFKKFGEIYFSVVNPGIIKGWKKHLKMTQNLAVPAGAIKFVLYDDRKSSRSSGEVQEIDLGMGNYSLLRIPPQVWYSFKAVGKSCAIIANCPDMPHDQAEVIVVDIANERIPYRWE